MDDAPPAATRFAHLQLRLLPQTPHPLVVDHPALPAQECPDPSVLIPGMAPRQLSDPLRQPGIGTGPWLRLHRRAIGFHYGTGASLRDATLDQEPYRRPLIGRLKPLFCEQFLGGI